MPLTILVIISCSPTKRLAENEYLLNKSKIKLKSKEIDIAALKSYERQSPNKTILGLKFHLFLYNMFAPEKTKGIPGWFKKIGEQPVIWDPVLTARTSEQFQRYLETKGYFDAKVTDSVSFNKKRANTIYTIRLNEPYRIRDIVYHFEDQDIAGFIFADTANCLIKKGGRFDKEVLQQERQRLEELLKNNGFFKFSKEYIFFDALEGGGVKQIDLRIIIKENITGVPDPETKVRHHYRYEIDRTYIYPNFSFRTDKNSLDSLTMDTVRIDNSNIIYYGKHRIKPETVLFPNQCTPGSIYRLDKVKKTYGSYSSLGLFRLINIQFSDRASDMPDSSAFKNLDCFIELSPRKVQSYQTEIVGTNSSGDFGARVNLSYTNYNLFHGAENLGIKLTGAVESMKKRTNNLSQAPMYEGGVESSLAFPKFLLPFPAQEINRKFNPRTSINVSYNYQNRPYYIRTIASTSLSYHWKGNSFNSHQIVLPDFNYVWLPKGIIDSSFRAYIDSSSLKNSFTNHTILAARYTFEYTTRVIEKKEDFIFFRANLESAGNVTYLIANNTSIFPNDSFVFKVPYFRYLKSDFDFRIYRQITKGNKLVYRIFAGVGYPLGYQKTLPFEKMYFAGGPNGIRAWSTASLGPGSQADTISKSLYGNSLGDIKLEANLEYRFKLFWVMEGALFVDAGNVWNYYEIYPGSSFKWGRFYKEIAVGTGLGTRFDFTFLLLRFDFGLKLRDPAIQEGSRWIDLNRSVEYRFFPKFRTPERNTRLIIQFGIGYPF